MQIIELVKENNETKYLKTIKILEVLKDLSKKNGEKRIFDEIYQI